MILVTGYKGFIGSYITKELDSRNLKWIGYDLKDGDDIRDIHKLDTVFSENNIDTVIHLAALASPTKSMMFPDDYISTNINGTNNLVNCSKRYGIKQFIFFSSSCVYGNRKPPNKEEEPYESTNTYATTKIAGELLVKASDIAYTIIRPFTLYGLNGRKDQVIYKWINLIKQGKPITILGDATNKRGYIYIDDLIKIVIDTIGNSKAFNQVFNIGGTEVVTLKELANIFKETVKCEIDFKPDIQYAPLLKGDTYENFADISKAKELLGFNPKENFRKNIEYIIKKELCQN